MNFLSAEATQKAKLHARSEFPRVSVGFILGGRYYPQHNYSDDALEEFALAPIALSQAKEKGLEAVVFSKPSGVLYPTAAEMQLQLDLGLPFALMPLNDMQIGDPVCWGDSLMMAPLEGRAFIHGVADCYTLIRDAYRLGWSGMAARGFPQWPFDPIALPNFARDDAWWLTNRDFYTKEIRDVGFEPIPREHAQPGDVFVISIHSSKPNHAGVLVEPNTLLHHLPSRVSTTQQAGIYARQADAWYRYRGEVA